jgi:S-DNA-T family DNA segregation ATPase FtsK/SpoIIIE
MRSHVSGALRKSAGILLVALAAAMLLSLFTYSHSDPSPSTASTFPVRNVGGTAGAMFWGFMLQYFGLASVVAICAAYTAGRSLISPSYIRRPLSTALLASVMGMLFASMALAYVSSVVLSEWPTPAGLGGLFGYVVRADIVRLVAEHGITRYLHAIVFVLLMLAAMTSMYFALGMTQESILRFENFIARIYSKVTRKERPDIRPQSRIVEAFRRLAPKKKARTTQSKKSEEKAERSLVRKSRYDLPPLGLLNQPRVDRNFGSNEELNEKKARMLENILTEFGVVGRITSIKTGPVITLFEMEPGRGTKTSRITALAEDIARDMSALSARVAVIPGTNKIGVELPNAHRRTVYIREQLESPAFSKPDMILPISLGADTGGRAIFVDLARMPHLLIAGTTGSGKSVGVNGMLLSLMYKYRPDEVKFIMIDPKMLEFSVYADIPHLLIPVVTDPVKAVAALKWAVREMEDRNKNMSALGARNIESYNAKAANMEGRHITREVQTGFDPATGEPMYETKKIEIKPMPYIIVVVDEMADLMLVAGKEVEAAIARLAAMARAAGIHLILSTQRPSVDVITGTIKSNFPNRIAYRVASKIDSRTIINEQGAELMLGKGDMLYMATGGSLIRVHGAYTTEDEIERVVRFVKSQARPNYVRNVTAEKPRDGSAMSLLDRMSEKGGGDDLYARAVQIVLSSDRPSISYLQRQLGIGYNKSANLIEKMQANGILSAPDSTGKRVVLGKKT